MTVQITIIGLGQTGTSLGLALAAHTDKVLRVGHDKEYGAEQLAKKKGAVDKTNHNLPSSVEEAGLVVLALPVHQVRETLDFIARDLKKDTVVVDLSPVKAGVAQWAREILPQGVHYVGLVPSISPEFLWDTRTDRDAARADLFANSIFLLSAPRGTPGAALKLVSDFVSLLGATAMMTDLVESDGLMASAHVLPQLMSASLLNATIGQPGWQEVRKVASRAYYSATSAFSDEGDADALSMLSLHDRENVVRSLDRLITSLVELRDDIESGDEESIRKHLQSAREARENWLGERGRADWTRMEAEQPTERLTLMQRMFGTGIGRPPKRNG
jgi:prephenate dehydrogenase